MALVDSCVLYSTVNDAGAVTSPAIGLAGTVSNGSFIAAKFGNGHLATAVNNSDYISFPPTDFNVNKGAIGFWTKSKYAFPADTSLHSLFTNINGADLFSILTGSLARVSCSFRGTGLNANITFTDAWAVDDLIHWLYVWDNTAGFDGAKTFAVYKNGVEKGSSALAIGSMNPAANTYFGIYAGSVGRESDQAVDEIKIFNDMSAALLAEMLVNKDEIGFPIAGGKRMIDGGIRSNLIDRSVLVA